MIVKNIISNYGLKPHPEGGYYKISFWDSEEIPHFALPSEYAGPRAYMSSILYLLPKKEKCIFHKIKMNEAWAFHAGGPLKLYQFSPTGETTEVILGSGINESVFHVVPKGFWMGALPSNSHDYSLISCITAPGFTPNDWMKGEKEDLIKKYPSHIDIIEILT